ncbi:MAG TPA: hypothetical protein VK982_11395, partial [Bacteroidales bacterium]|nr:hypothetical protein [Bacteroidales bacterium]
GYTLPQQFLNGNKLRIYVQGTNLLTFTSYPGMDPEATNVTAGSATSAGSTFGNMPQSRSIIFGIELGI